MNSVYQQSTPYITPTSHQCIQTSSMIMNDVCQQSTTQSCLTCCNLVTTVYYIYWTYVLGQLFSGM